MSGWTAYTKLDAFLFLPMQSLSIAATTFVGQNIGVKKYDRDKKGARFGIICSIILAELVGVIIFTLAPHLIALFNSEPEVIAFGTRQAKTEALFYFLLAFSHCIAGIMRGAGKATVPMFTMLLTWCAIRITYISIMVKIIPEIGVIFWAYPLTWGLSAVILLVCLLRLDWKNARV